MLLAPRLLAFAPALRSTQHQALRCLSSSAAGGKTIFERLGGAPAMDLAVTNFYKKVLADDRVNKFFKGIDMAAQKRKQLAFLTMAFGGPNEYKGRSMSAGHAKLVRQQGLNDSHFDAIADNLASTLRELKIPEDVIKEVLAVAETTREDVLGRNKA